MLGMTNVNNRTRVQAGIKTGGQFVAETHQEPEGVLLTQAPSPLDEAAVAVVADLVRTSAAVEEGDWQRHHDKGYLRDLPTPPYPPEILELRRQADSFETLPAQEQNEILDKLKLPAAKHLLEPGQTLGNHKVDVADDVLAGGGKLGFVLASQKLITDANLPGTATMTKAGDQTEFSIPDGSIQHEVRVASSMVSLSSSSTDDDYTRNSWLARADISSFTGSMFERDRSGSLRENFKDHSEYAVMMDVVASSSFRDYESHFGEMNRGASEDGKTTFHPSMVAGYLDHMAEQTGQRDRDSFVNDLREVFRETDRRLIP
ncbi:hypothetical protein FBY31_0608 [Arthrobacter sp. SLBN-100]|nr:hypothetical protein FBY31_0608 [Arthrobacter sp. SLBN-100]